MKYQNQKQNVKLWEEYPDDFGEFNSLITDFFECLDFVNLKPEISSISDWARYFINLSEEGDFEIDVRLSVHQFSFTVSTSAIEIAGDIILESREFKSGKIQIFIDEKICKKDCALYESVTAAFMFDCFTYETEHGLTRAQKFKGFPVPRWVLKQIKNIHKEF